MQEAPPQLRNEASLADCGGRERSHGGKIIGKERKIMTPRRKTPRRKALERWWCFNWLLSAPLWGENAALTRLLWQNSTSVARPGSDCQHPVPPRPPGAQRLP